MFDWLDARLQQIFVTVGMGVSLGTLWRMIMRPETNLQSFVARAVICLTVGLVVGVVIADKWNLNGAQGVGVGAIAGFLSEEVLLFFQSRGRKLKTGKVDTSLSGDSDE